MITKKSKIEIQSEHKEVQEPRRMSFEIFFRKLVATGRAEKHHQAAMRSFAEQRGIPEGTEEQFEEVFKYY